MAEYFKEPQNPLKKIDETTGDITYVYPLTTDKQVIMSDGTRLNTILTENSVQTYIQSASTLTGSGTNGKFKATATGTYTSFTIGGVSYAVRAGSETEIELTNGVWYSFILDVTDKTINFKAGGGVSNSKLAETTATEADVLSGLTFYSGDKTIKTGTRKKVFGKVTVTSVGTYVPVDCGFKPDVILITGVAGNMKCQSLLVDVINNRVTKFDGYYMTGTIGISNFNSVASNLLGFEINDTGFSVANIANNEYRDHDWYYVAT